MADEAPQKRRVRSPGYPSISLKEAVERAKTLYAHAHTYDASLNDVLQHWDYSASSGLGRTTLAALKHFGLLVETGGRGEDRQVRLSKRALQIVQDEVEGSPERLRAIQEAALDPEIYKELRDKWNDRLPSAQIVRTFLVREKHFNPASVGGLLEDYRTTISFANLGESCILSEEETVKVGDYVQWVSDGIPRFPEPRKVTELSDDGEWARVEGSGSGVQVAELTVEKQSETKNPSPNPFSGTSVTMSKRDTFTCSEGEAVFIWPSKLTSADYNDFKVWADLIVKKIGRSVSDKSDED